MKPGRATSALRLFFASAGVIMVLFGLTLLVLDVVSAGEVKTWRGGTIYDWITSPWVEHVVILRDIVDWLQHPSWLEPLNPPVVFVLQLVPQSLALMAVGSYVVWKALK